jgi:hypothetical protein
MLAIEMLPADYGDCLLVEYGDGEKHNRLLIDGGLGSTYEVLRDRIRSLPAGARHFELLIVTHIDADHIEGTIRLLGSMESLGVTFGDVWFNGWKHLPGSHVSDEEYLNGRHGEFLSALIHAKSLPWNCAFGGNAAVIPDDGPLPRHDLPGGLRLTLLSPTVGCLDKLRPKWDREVRKAGLDRNSVGEVLAAIEATRRLRGDDELLAYRPININRLLQSCFAQDTAEANGSSIAVLAEYTGKSCLLTGDAWPSILSSSVRRLLQNGNSARLDLDALKLPHHGSRANISVEFLDLLNCGQYLFSSSGKRFRHPDPESVARVISRAGSSPSLYFNYRTEINRPWEDPRLSNGKYQYNAFYPESEDGGIRVEL